MGAENPNVVSVFLNKGHELQTTRSWEFLGLESDGVVPKDSIWEKARYGEGVIIANIDTGQFLILIVKVKFFKGGGCFLSTIFPKQVCTFILVF